MTRARVCEVISVHGNSVESFKLQAIAVEHDLVLARPRDTKPVIRETLLRVEIEDPEQATSFEGNQFVCFMFEVHISLRQLEEVGD